MDDTKGCEKFEKLSILWLLCSILSQIKNDLIDMKRILLFNKLIG